MFTRSHARALLAALTFAACQRERIGPEEHAARTAVVRYNEALVQAFRSGSVDPLEPYAGPEERARVAGVIQALASAGKVMEARQTAFRVRQVTIPARPDAVVVVDAVESWEYEHRDRARSRDPTPVKRARYRIAYNLVRRAEALVVHQIVEHEMPPGEPEER